MLAKSLTEATEWLYNYILTKAGWMKVTVSSLIVFTVLLVSGYTVRGQGQADEICREYGETPTREAGSQGRPVPFVFGRVSIRGLSSTARRPRITVIYSDTLQPAVRQVLGRSGNFCFRRPGSGGTLILEVDGIETSRRSLSEFAAMRHQEDFDVIASGTETTAPPSVISTKFSRPPNEQTADLYRKAAEAEGEKQTKKAIEYVKEIVAIDGSDFIAWAKLGSLHLSLNSLDEAAAAFEKSVAVRADYTPALLNLGIVKALRNDYPAAITIFKRAVASDPQSARGYRLLGEAYLHNKEGKLGVLTLDKALELDPIGMAECHLLIARLFDLAGAKKVAAREYRDFLKKVPDYPDRKTLEKYIKDNPPE